jgi:DNA ligase D-like protein (predicted 3'-phosphoesterase)
MPRRPRVARAARARGEVRAIRAIVPSPLQLEGAAESVRDKARALGLFGWVRSADAGGLAVHAEGAPIAIDALIAFLAKGVPGTGAAGVEIEEVPLEGHEQFGLRGVSAGAFVVKEHAASTHHFDMRLEVAGVMRSWALPKGPSLDPAVKRLAVEVPDHSIDQNEFEGPTGAGGVVLWDRGLYEQGGRVAWPEALSRGHAVFVLHGEKLRGGFALQRTRAGAKPQWLLVKRRDEQARAASDVVAERPASVLSGRTLGQVLVAASRSDPAAPDVAPERP